MRRTARPAAFVALALLTSSLALASPTDAQAAPGDGPLDPSYGVDGVATLVDPDPGEDPGYSFAVSADVDPLGRALVLGLSHDDGVWRRTPDGAPDSTFGTAGFAALPDLTGRRLEATADHVVVAGVRDGDPGAHRLLEDGTVDGAFGDDGFAGVAAGPGAADVRNVAVAGDGGVALVITGETFGGPSFAVHRFGPDGRPDLGFGNGGIVTFTAPDGLEVDGPDLAFDPAGRLIVAEYRQPAGVVAGPMSSRVVRLRADGSLDPTFGSGGAVVVEGFGVHVLDLAPDDGAIHLGGAAPRGDLPHGAATVLRLSADGRPDLRFGPAGQATTVPDDVASALVWGIAALPGGRTAAMSDDADNLALVSVLRGDGTLEPSLGEGGLVRTGHRWTFDGVGRGSDDRLLVATSWAADVDQHGVSQVRAYAPDLPTTVPAVTGVLTYESSLDVRWTPAEVASGPGPVRAYQVFVLDESGAVASARTVPGDVRQVSLPGLPVGEDHTYDVVVVPYDELGALPASEPFAVEPSSAPAAVEPAGAVRDLGAFAGSDFAIVRWDPPTDDGGAPIDGYSVIAVRADDGTFVTWRNVAPDVRWMTLPGLADPAQVRIYVTAITSEGFGSLAPPADPSANSGNVATGRPSLPWAAMVPLGQHALLTWGAPLEHGEVAFEHHVISIVGGNVLADWKVTDEVGRHAIVATPPGAVVYVMARSASGFGPPQVFEVD